MRVICFVSRAGPLWPEGGGGSDLARLIRLGKLYINFSSALYRCISVWTWRVFRLPGGTWRPHLRCPYAASVFPIIPRTSNRYMALAFRVLSSDFKFAGIIVADGAVDALISLTRSVDKPCRLR